MDKDRSKKKGDTLWKQVKKSAAKQFQYWKPKTQGTSGRAEQAGPSTSFVTGSQQKDASTATDDVGTSAGASCQNHLNQSPSAVVEQGTSTSVDAGPSGRVEQAGTSTSFVTGPSGGVVQGTSTSFDAGKQDASSVKPFDLKSCRSKLEEHYQKTATVPTSVWCKKSVVDIHQIYTRLSWVKEEQTPTGTTQSELKHYSDLFTANKNGVIPKRILVQGQTGIGKSTFVKKLLVDWVEVNKGTGDEQAAVLKNFELVVAVNLKEVSKCQSLKDVIRLSNVLAKEDKYMTENLVDYITYNQEKVLLIFDGYDEYRIGCNSEIHEIFHGNSLRSCCVLITTRISKADELRGGEDLHAEITGFSQVEREDFMRRFLNSEEVSKLKDHLYKRKLEELAKVPLLLLFFCILWRKGQSKSFPNSKTKLYVDIVQFILNHSHSKQTADKTKTKQYVELKSFKEILSEIGKVALQSLLKDDHLFEYSQLSDSVHCDDSVFIGLLQLTEYSETLRPVGMVSFIHKSIQEFLAAWYVTYRCIPEGGNLDEISVKLEECLALENVFQFVCGLSEDGALAALRHLKSVRIADPSLDLSKAVPDVEGKTDVPLSDVTLRQQQFNDLVLNSFDEVESKAELSEICLDCLGSILLSLTRYLPDDLVIKTTDTNSFSLIFRRKRIALDKIVQILVSKSFKTLNVTDFIIKLKNPVFLVFLCNCWFTSILCFRYGQVYLYITDLVLSCMSHARLCAANFSCFRSELTFLRVLEFYSNTECIIDSLCHLLDQVPNPHRCSFSTQGCHLTSKGAVKLASLLPRFQNVTRLDLHLAECTEESLTKLVASIKHKTLQRLELRKVTDLTSAVAEALGQSLPELSSLQTLLISGSDGCTFLLQLFGTLTITDLTESSAEAVTRLIDVIKHKPLKNLELSEIHLTSAAAEALGQLLPELSALRTLNISGLTECSDEAVTKLVGAIKHKILVELRLNKIPLTSAVAETLGQSLPKLSALQTLAISGLDECNLQHTEMEALFGRFKRTSSLKDLSISRFSARGSLASFTKNLCFFPYLESLQLASLYMGEADLFSLLENLKYIPDLRSLYLMGNPLSHAVRLMVPYLLKQKKLEEVCFGREDVSVEDLNYVQRTVKGKRPQLRITVIGFWLFL